MMYFITDNKNHIKDIIGHREKPGEPPVSLNDGRLALKISPQEEGYVRSLGEGEIFYGTIYSE